MAQAEFCHQIRKTTSGEFAPPTARADSDQSIIEVPNSKHVEKILISIESIQQQVNAVQAENKEGFEKVVAGMETVAKENFKLRQAKEHLEKLQAEKLFELARGVDPRAFKIICTVLSEGSVAKARRRPCRPGR